MNVAEAPGCSGYESSGETFVDTEWYREFRSRAAAARVPVSGMIELTRRCNLRCGHCYHRDHVPVREMDTALILKVLSEAAEMGCLYMTFTGGEPFLREDFDVIYRTARRLGMVVSVFSNLTCLSEDLAELFSEMPPRVVEGSIYAVRAAEHDAVTGVAGSFDALLQGIKLLQRHGVRVALKTMIMPSTGERIAEIERLAQDLGVSFRVDPYVFPRFHGERGEHHRFHMDPKDAVRIELASGYRRSQWLDYARRRVRLDPGRRLFQCGAGTTGFFVDASGRLSPCLMTTRYRYDLAGRSFAEVWHAEIAAAVAQPASPDYVCADCSLRAYCTGCAAVNYLETGDENSPDSYVCALAQCRRDVLDSMVRV